MNTTVAADGRVPECRELRPFALFLHFHHEESAGYVLELQAEAIDAATAPFVAQGLPGDAGNWVVIARQAAKADAPDIAKLLESERLLDESDIRDDQGYPTNYLAISADETDLVALRRLGAMMAKLYHDPERLEALIVATGWEEFDC